MRSQEKSKGLGGGWWEDQSYVHCITAGGWQLMPDTEVGVTRRSRTPVTSNCAGSGVRKDKKKF